MYHHLSSISINVWNTFAVLIMTVACSCRTDKECVISLILLGIVAACWSQSTLGPVSTGMGDCLWVQVMFASC